MSNDAEQKILAVDVGGSHVKLLLSGGGHEVRRFESGPNLEPKEMVERIVALTEDWSYGAVSVGIPALVHGGRVMADPVNLGPGWIGFDFSRAFGKPTKVVNDAAMQALGSYEGGKMLFLGLGTGLGTALVVDGVVEPMELAHLPGARRSQRPWSDWRRRSSRTMSCSAVEIRRSSVTYLQTPGWAPMRTRLSEDFVSGIRPARRERFTNSLPV